ncbi:hypothetical protein AB4175_23215 [Vibrio cyclitrophicus]
MENNKKLKWLTYTVGVGILPLLARLLAGCLFENDLEWFATSDFIGFGFVMHISILNELEHMKEDGNWKTRNNFSSVSFVFMFGLLTLANLTVEAQPGLINPETLKTCSMIIAFISFLLAHSVFKRLSSESKALSNGGATC